MSENNFHMYENESWIGNIWKVFLLCFRMNPGPSSLTRQKTKQTKEFKYCRREGLSANISNVKVRCSHNKVYKNHICHDSLQWGTKNVLGKCLFMSVQLQKVFLKPWRKAWWSLLHQVWSFIFCDQLSMTNAIFNFWLAICTFQGGQLHHKYIHNSKSVTCSMLYPLRKARWYLDYAIYFCAWSHKITQLLSKSHLLPCYSTFFYCNGMLT